MEEQEDEEDPSFDPESDSEPEHSSDSDSEVESWCRSVLVWVWGSSLGGPLSQLSARLERDTVWEGAAE